MSIPDRMRELKEQATKILRVCVKVIVVVAKKIVEVAQRVVDYLSEKVEQAKAAATDVKASENAAEEGVHALHAAHVVQAVGVKAAARKLVEKLPHDFLSNLGLHIKTWTLKLCSFAKAHQLTWTANFCASWCSMTPAALATGFLLLQKEEAQ
jgi:hypothetical protein